MTNYNYGFSGTTKPKASRKTKDHGQNRVCAEDKCDKILSRYNDRKECFEHHKFRTPRVRGRILLDTENE